MQVHLETPLHLRETTAVLQLDDALALVAIPLRQSLIEGRQRAEQLAVVAAVFHHDVQGLPEQAHSVGGIETGRRAAGIGQALRDHFDGVRATLREQFPRAMVECGLPS